VFMNKIEMCCPIDLFRGGIEAAYPNFAMSPNGTLYTISLTLLFANSAESISFWPTWDTRARGHFQEHRRCRDRKIVRTKVYGVGC
jgi:hypothetical protein